jgi:hypothetical protein
MDTSQYFQDQALECREAARASDNRHDRHGLEQLAGHYEREAARMSRSASAAQEEQHLTA